MRYAVLRKAATTPPTRGVALAPALQRQRAEVELWGHGGPEPSLEDLLADPIVHLVMRRDRIGLTDTRAAIAAAQARLRPSTRGTP